VDLEAAPLELAGAQSVAHEAADGPTGFSQPRGEPRADAAGRARHERAPAVAWRARFASPFEGAVG
jgi:hypothetical protein